MTTPATEAPGSDRDTPAVREGVLTPIRRTINDLRVPPIVVAAWESPPPWFFSSR